MIVLMFVQNKLKVCQHLDTVFCI